MKICIVGWYGTETLGDRAILDGILSMFSIAYKNVSFYMGSLYPFYSQRTMFEENEKFRESSNGASVTIFDVKCGERDNFVKESDMLIIGGGPLMDLEELYIIDDCFKTAKKHDIPTMVVGCGVGPLRESRYIKLVKSILSKSDKIALRDEVSLRNLNELFDVNKEIQCLGDPAIISIMNYKQKHNPHRDQDYIAINFREPPINEYGECNRFGFDKMCELVYKCSENFSTVKLVPMHTFFKGGDDREFLTKVYQRLEDNNKTKVCHEPMNLYQLYDIYMNANACIGMRYHSVVMQTILNGNNYIMDYTSPEKGKVSGFIGSLPKNEFYSNRMINLHKNQPIDCETKICYELARGIHYNYPENNILDKYIKFLLE